MIYQQEVKENDSFYSQYKDKKIVYSKEVSQHIGVVQRDTAIKVGDDIIKGILISSTMESFVILVSLTEHMKKSIYDQKGALIVLLKFVCRETGKTMLFTIHTKFLSINHEGLQQKDMSFIAMHIRRKIPNDLIRIFGLYIEAEKERLSKKKEKVECILLVNGSKIDCIPKNITKDRLILSIEGIQGLTSNQKAVTILKIINTEDVLEIIGTIKEIDTAAIFPEIHLHFLMEDQSPRFSYSIHVLRTLINN